MSLRLLLPRGDSQARGHGQVVREAGQLRDEAELLHLLQDEERKRAWSDHYDITKLTSWRLWLSRESSRLHISLQQLLLHRSPFDFEVTLCDAT